MKKRFDGSAPDMKSRPSDPFWIHALSAAHRRMIALPFSIFLLTVSLLLYPSTNCAQTQGLPKPEIESTVTADAIPNLPISSQERLQLQTALSAQDYYQAETLLMKSIEAHPKSSQLLTLLGSILFLDRQYLNAAIALKKAEALEPLDDRSRFTLSMAYVVLDHNDWARPELEKLRHRQENNPLYLYWLARLDYDAQQFNDGIEKLKKVLELDPNSMKAYDNLALCYEALGQHDQAVGTYLKAIELNRVAPTRSPWPALNLGSLLSRLGKLDQARTYLQEAVRYDPKLAQAHYQLGLVFEKQEDLPQAIQELAAAAALKPDYAEPHYALGRIYRRAGQGRKAEEALTTFQEIKRQKRDGPR